MRGNFENDGVSWRPFVFAGCMGVLIAVVFLVLALYLAEWVQR